MKHSAIDSRNFKSKKWKKVFVDNNKEAWTLKELEKEYAS